MYILSMSRAISSSTFCFKNLAWSKTALFCFFWSFFGTSFIGVSCLIISYFLYVSINSSSANLNSTLFEIWLVSKIFLSTSWLTSWPPRPESHCLLSTKSIPWAFCSICLNTSFSLNYFMSLVFFFLCKFKRFSKCSSRSSSSVSFFLMRFFISFWPWVKTVSLLSMLLKLVWLYPKTSTWFA